jgi:hypothetical protein
MLGSWPVSPAVGSRPLVVPVPVSPSIRHCDENVRGARSLTRRFGWADCGLTIVGPEVDQPVGGGS